MSDSSNSIPEDENLESSPKTEETPDANAESSPEDASTESSPETEDNEEKSILDIVEKVLEPELSSEKEPETKETETEDKEELPPFHEHPRWKEVVKERDDARIEIESFKESSTRMSKIDRYMETNHIEPEQATSAYEFMAHINNGRFNEALSIINPVMEQLQQLTGQVLPDDLETKVNEGYMDETSATELAKARQTVQTTNLNAQRQQDNSKRQNIATQQNAMIESVNSLIEGYKVSDPDFSKKEGLMFDKVARMVQEKGSPTTPELANNLIKQAHVEITDLFSSMTPSKSAQQTSPTSKRTYVPSTKPKTMLEAVKLGLEL